MLLPLHALFAVWSGPVVLIVTEVGVVVLMRPPPKVNVFQAGVVPLAERN